ncbi:MAG: LytS/YhcK type 5TM receptor domain-containing protein, partial [Ferrovibrionaceae bacterium]
MLGISGDIIFTLGHGVGILALVIAAYSFLVRGPQAGSRLADVLTGVIFGAAAVVSMHDTVGAAPDMVFDPRNMLIALAAPFGGPVAAAVGAGLAGAYRLSLGGPGIWAGSASILVAALAGLAFSRLFRPRDGAYRARDLALLGLVASLCQATVFLMPLDRALPAFERGVLPLTAVTVAGVMALGLALGSTRRRLIVEARNKERDALFQAIFHNTADCFY